MIHRSLLIGFAIALLAGCARPDPPVLSRDTMPAKTAEVQASEESVWSSVEASAAGTLQAKIKAEVAKANEKKLKPIVYIGAPWCKPCAAIKRYRRDPLMLDALKGTYVIDLDLDDWKAKEIDALGFNSGEVPHFYTVDGEGHFAGRTITSSVWGEDIPANMAPPLKAFFSR